MLRRFHQHAALGPLHEPVGMNGIPVRVRQGSPEWLAYRRTVITATDIGALLGVSPWACEADVADAKVNGTQIESTLRMRKGSALEPFIASEYEAKTGKRVRRFRAMVRHPEYEWAAASPDAAVIGERRLLEFKHTSSRTRFSEGIPQDVAAQVAWQLGVTGYPVAEVVVMTDDSITILEQEADDAVFADLVAVAQDFRRRLAEGGPFATSDERIRREHPLDDGTILPATPDLIALVDQLRDAKAAIKDATDREETIASAIRAILRDASGVEGLLTYRKSKDSSRVNWPAVANEYRALLEATRSVDELEAVVTIHSEIKTGPRVLRLSARETE